MTRQRLRRRDLGRIGRDLMEMAILPLARICTLDKARIRLQLPRMYSKELLGEDPRTTIKQTFFFDVTCVNK